jgi:sRNA-binding protein
MTDTETTIAELARRFPEAFTAERWRAHRLLAIGAHQALLEACPDLAGAIWLALNRYTGRLLYQRALVEGAARVDLAGKPVGTVSAAHAAKAAAKGCGHSGRSRGASRAKARTARGEANGQNAGYRKARNQAAQLGRSQSGRRRRHGGARVA